VHRFIAQFELHVQEDQEAGRHTDGQPHDIDERESPVTPEIPEGSLEIVSEHESCLIGCVFKVIRFSGF
jgi:hypothetical protein